MPGKNYDRGEVIRASLLALLGTAAMNREDLITRSNRPAWVADKIIDAMLAEGSLVLTDDNKIKGVSHVQSTSFIQQ